MVFHTGLRLGEVKSHSSCSGRSKVTVVAVGGQKSQLLQWKVKSHSCCSGRSKVIIVTAQKHGQYNTNVQEREWMVFPS